MTLDLVALVVRALTVERAWEASVRLDVVALVVRPLTVERAERAWEASVGLDVLLLLGLEAKLVALILRHASSFRKVPLSTN